MFVYRIEDKRGFGIYTSSVEELDLLVQQHYWGPLFHPTPKEDGFSKHVRAQLRNKPNYWLFGFITVNQMFEWFDNANPNCFGEFLKAGAQIVKYHVADRYVITKTHQCVFRQDHAVIVNIFHNAESLKNEPF